MSKAFLWTKCILKRAKDAISELRVSSSLLCNWCRRYASVNIPVVQLENSPYQQEEEAPQDDDAASVLLLAAPATRVFLAPGAILALETPSVFV